MSAEWSDRLNAFWCGANDREYIALKHSHTIFVYPTWKHPEPPAEIIQHTKEIETTEDFEDALENGERFICAYLETTK